MKEEFELGADIGQRETTASADDLLKVNHVSEMPSFPPDLSRYPLFAKAVYAVVELRAGEMLYIPRRWWHWVTSFERNLALSLWHAAHKATAAVPADKSDTTEVDSITDPNEFQPRYFSKKEPVLIRSDDVRKWPASTKWTDEYLKDASGDRRYGVGISPDPQMCATRGDHRTRLEVMTLQGFLEGSRSSEYHYLFQNDTIPNLSPNDWSIPEFWKECFPQAAFRAPLWFCFGGDKGITSALHFDYYENLLAQITGSKRVLLFSPAQTPYLYRREQIYLSPQRP